MIKCNTITEIYEKWKTLYHCHASKALVLIYFHQELSYRKVDIHPCIITKKRKDHMVQSGILILQYQTTCGLLFLLIRHSRYRLQLFFHVFATSWMSAFWLLVHLQNSWIAWLILPIRLSTCLAWPDFITSSDVSIFCWHTASPECTFSVNLRLQNVAFSEFINP